MKIRRILALVLFALTCLLFTGCSSYVNVYTTQTLSDSYVCSIDVYVSSADARAIEGNSGKKVSTYLRRLVEVCGAEYISTLTVDESDNIYLNTTASVDAASLKRENYKTQVQEGLFFNKVTVSFDNPLNAYKDAYKNGLTTKPSKGSELYFVYVILYGDEGLADFSSYFGVDKSIADDLSLAFLLKTRTLYNSDSDVEFLGMSKYFKWSTTVNEANGTVTYTRYSVNSLPWFVVAIIAGVAVVLIIFFATLKSKAKPLLVDRSEIERIRSMRKHIPSNAKIVTPPKPNPSDSQLFDEETDSNGEKKDEDEKDN